MEKYELSSRENDYIENSDKIHRISCQIQSATKKIIRCVLTEDQANTLLENIITVLNHWAGSTYVGSEKNSDLSKAFQAFFKVLYQLLLELSNIGGFGEAVKSSLYRGKIYRYLGHSSSTDCNNKIEPKYNDIYVSWSKQPNNSYLESKLYGTMTWMSAEIVDPFLGIDLEGLEETIYRLTGIECSISRGNEHEVVFPTIKECIMEIRYIKEPDEVYEDDQT